MNETSNRRRLLAGASAAITSGLLLFSAFTQLTASTAEPTRAQIAASGFFAVLHVGLTAAVAFAIAHLVRHKADRLGLTGAALTILGATVGARIIAFIQLSLLQDSAPGAVRGSMTSLLRNDTAVWASLIPIGLLYPLGIITLAVALWVARPVPRVVAVVLAIGGILFPMGRAIDIVPAVWMSDALVAIAYGYLSKDILTRRELWDDKLAMHSPEQRADSEYDPSRSFGALAQP